MLFFFLVSSTAHCLSAHTQKSYRYTLLAMQEPPFLLLFRKLLGLGLLEKNNSLIFYYCMCKLVETLSAACSPSNTGFILALGSRLIGMMTKSCFHSLLFLCSLKAGNAETRECFRFLTLTMYYLNRNGFKIRISYFQFLESCYFWKF